MAITEESRHHLHQRLEEVLGSEEAVTLMEHLPPTGWAGVATSRDLDHLSTITARDLHATAQQGRAELKAETAKLRTEIAQMGASLQERIDDRHATVMAGLAELRAELHQDRRVGQRQVIGALVVALIAIVITVAGLG